MFEARTAKRTSPITDKRTNIDRAHVNTSLPGSLFQNIAR